MIRRSLPWIWRSSKSPKAFYPLEASKEPGRQVPSSTHFTGEEVKVERASILLQTPQGVHGRSSMNPGLPSCSGKTSVSHSKKDSGTCRILSGTELNEPADIYSARPRAGPPRTGRPLAGLGKNGSYIRKGAKVCSNPAIIPSPGPP